MCPQKNAVIFSLAPKRTSLLLKARTVQNRAEPCRTKKCCNRTQMGFICTWKLGALVFSWAHVARIQEHTQIHVGPWFNLLPESVYLPRMKKWITNVSREILGRKARLILFYSLKGSKTISAPPKWIMNNPISLPANHKLLLRTEGLLPSQGAHRVLGGLLLTPPLLYLHSGLLSALST